MSAVAYVLTRAAEEGFAEAIIPAASRFDPLLRGSIRKAAQKAFARASAMTKLTDEAHTLRLALLIATNRVPQAVDDVAAVGGAFEAAKIAFPKQRGRAFWPVSLGVAGGALAAAAVAAVILLFPSPRDRFLHSSLGQGMSDGLTDYVVGVSRRDVARQEKGRDLLLSKGVKRQIGGAAYDFLGKALDQTKAAAGSLSPDEADRETEALGSTLAALDVELATRKLPAFFDVYADSGVGVTGVWLLGYYVDDRASVVVGDTSMPVVWGRRTDNLNLEVGGKVYESKALHGFVVSIDDVQQWVVRVVVPALAKGAGFAFGEKSAQQEGSGGTLAAKAGDKIRSELLAPAGLGADDASEMSDLFVQRHSAFVRLSAIGDELYEPRGLRPSPKLKRALAIRKEEVDAKEISRIEDRLARFEPAFDRIVAAQAALDETRFATGLACQRAASPCVVHADDDLEHTLGQKEISGPSAAAVAGRLTMIARSDRSPELALAEAEMGTGGYLAVYLVERELGLSPSWFSRYGVKDEAEHGQLGAATFDKPPAELRKAAESAYAKVFGAPMPQVSRTSTAK